MKIKRIDVRIPLKDYERLERKCAIEGVSLNKFVCECVSSNMDATDDFEYKMRVFFRLLDKSTGKKLPSSGISLNTGSRNRNN